MANGINKTAWAKRMAPGRQLDNPSLNNKDVKKIAVIKAGTTKGSKHSILANSRPGNSSRPSAKDVGIASSNDKIAADGASVYDAINALFKDEFSHMSAHLTNEITGGKTLSTVQGSEGSTSDHNTAIVKGMISQIAQTNRREISSILFRRCMVI